MGKRLKHSRYITGFDGVRTLAVIGVILYHLFPYQVAGGFLGVPIFFVLSGYLITDLLCQEWRENNSIDVPGFYLRRIRRLYPALVTCVTVSVAYITLFQRDLLTNIKAIMITNYLYVYNWFQVYEGQSYFDKFAMQSPFSHLWSLSIEGQFYFVWPFVVLFLLWRTVSKKNIFRTIMVLSLVSAILMAILYHPGVDPSRVYYGTDTRIFSILIGAALAIIWPSSKLKSNLDISLRIIVDVVGIISLLLLLWMFSKMTGEGSFVYRGGMYLFSIVSAIFIATIAHPGADMNRLMSNPLFTWIGKRSYGIYLYQIPVMVFFEDKIQVGKHPDLYAVIEVIIILIISAASYRYLEQPLQHFDYQQTWAVFKSLIRRKGGSLKDKIAISTVAVVVLLAGVGALQAKPAKSVQQDQGLAQVIAKNEAKTAKHNKKVESGKAHQKETQHLKGLKLTKAEKAKAANIKITAVGDSVLADASSSLQNIFPQMYINAKVGRQVNAMVDILRTQKAQGELQDNILIVGGTNGPFTSQDMQNIMEIAGDRHVYWVNVHVPTRRWQDPVNADLKAAAKKYHNLKIINWYKYSKGHTNWFYDDNVHPNPYGLKYYDLCVARGILG